MNPNQPKNDVKTNKLQKPNIRAQDETPIPPETALRQAATGAMIALVLGALAFTYNWCESEKSSDRLSPTPTAEVPPSTSQN